MTCTYFQGRVTSCCESPGGRNAATLDASKVMETARSAVSRWMSRRARPGQGARLEKADGGEKLSTAVGGDGKMEDATRCAHIYCIYIY